VLSMRPGPLVAEFAACASQVVVAPEREAGRRSRLHLLSRLGHIRLSREGFSLRTAEGSVGSLASEGYDVIYANTALCVETAVAVKLASCNSPLVVAHIHELATMIGIHAPNLGQSLTRVDQLIVASGLVKRELAELFALDEALVKVVYESSDRVGVGRLDAGLRHNQIVVGAVGYVHWRKGHDLFLQTARYLRLYRPDVRARFLWLGKLDDKHRAVVDADIEKAGLSDVVNFVDEVDDPSDFYEQLDVLLLPSREDPFPLVAIEAGSRGIPVLCFSGATGTAEVLRGGGGVIVPYLDVRALAEAVGAYWDDPDALCRDAAKAKEVFSAFTPENQCPKLAQVVEEAVSRRGRRGVKRL